MKTNLIEKIALIATGVIILAVSIILPSCQSTAPKLQAVAPTQQITDIGTNVSNAGTSLKATTATIKTNATQGQKVTPPTLTTTFNPIWSAILTATGVQDQIATNLDAVKAEATAAEASSKQFEQQYNDTNAKLIAAQNNITKELQEKFIIFAGILFFISLILFGVAIWAGGNKILLWGGAIAGTGSAVAIVVVQSVALIPWIVGAMALICIGFLVYSYVTKAKTQAATTTTVTKLKASTRELVKTIEACKPKMSVQGRFAMFGDGPVPAASHIIQSNETEELVRNIRNEIEKAPAIPATVAVDMDGEGMVDSKDVHKAWFSPNRPPTAPSTIIFK